MRGGIRTESVRAQHHSAAADAFAGKLTTGPTGVTVRVDGVRRLPPKLVHKPLVAQKEPTKTLEGALRYGPRLGNMPATFLR